MDSPVIFFPTKSVDDVKSTSDTFLLVISAYNPLPPSISIFGTPKAKVVLIFVVFKEPLHIPVIDGTADNVALKPSPDIVSMRLNLSIVSPSGVYLRIVPVLTPTKLNEPFVVAPAPVIVILSELLKLGDITLWSTVSATKSEAYPDTEDVSW